MAEQVPSRVNWLRGLRQPPRRLFLVDGIGALVSAGLLGLVVGNLPDVFGMPQAQALLLAAVPVVFALYSFLCHFLAGPRWAVLLRVIACANLGYCGLTLATACCWCPTLQPLGWAYFIGESVVVGLLAWLELRTAYSITAVPQV